MRHLSATQFVFFGVIVTLLTGVAVYVVCGAWYSSALTADVVIALSRNGKSVTDAAVEFGFMPAFWVTLSMLGFVLNRYAKIRTPRKTKNT